MFGFLTLPCSCRVGVDAALYQRAFCGLCDVLADDYGLPTRLLINRDSTFIALLTAAQMPEDISMGWSRRCNPLSRPHQVLNDNPALAYAAAVTVCGLQIKLQDNRLDEPPWRSTICGLFALMNGGKFARAKAVLSDTGFCVADLLARLAEQPVLEAAILADRVDPWCAVEPSAHALGIIFSHSATIAGQQSASASLYTAGYALGQLIYILDSYEDQRGDYVHGRFNFLAELSRWQDGATVPSRELAKELVAQRQCTLSCCWVSVETQRYRSLLDAVLLEGVPTKAERLLSEPVEPSESVLPADSGWTANQMAIDPDQGSMQSNKDSGDWDQCLQICGSCNCSGCGS